MMMLTRCWLFCGASFLKSFLTSFFRILNAECIQVVLLGSMSKKERKGKMGNVSKHEAKLRSPRALRGDGGSQLLWCGMECHRK